MPLTENQARERQDRTEMSMFAWRSQSDFAKSRAYHAPASLLFCPARAVGLRRTAQWCGNVIPVPHSTRTQLSARSSFFTNTCVLDAQVREEADTLLADKA